MLIKSPFMQYRVGISDSRASSKVEAKILRVRRKHFRLARIEPERLDTIAVVMLIHLFPDKAPRFWICRVIVVQIYRTFWMIILEHHERRETPFRAYQQTALLHRDKVLAERIDSRPDRDHELDAQFLQLLYHSSRIGPCLRVEAPFSLQGPVEKIDNDHREGKTALFVFTRN